MSEIEGVTPVVETPIPPTPVIPQPSALELQVAEMQRVMLNQQEEIRRLSNVTRPPEVPTPPPSPDFYTDPKGAIRQEVRDSVAPLNAFIETFQRGQLYIANKATLRNSFPNLAQYWSILEPKLDQIFSGGTVDPNFNNLQVAISNIVGQLTLSGQGFAQPPAVIPPSIPGAAPITPPVTPVVNYPPLTEQQKVLARYNGMTDEEFSKGLTTATIIKV
jgi:hypothetical protein